MSFLIDVRRLKKANSYLYLWVLEKYGQLRGETIRIILIFPQEILGF